jgi:hypothetical protein
VNWVISVVLGTHYAGKNVRYTVLKYTKHIVTDNVSEVKRSKLSTVMLFFSKRHIFVRSETKWWHSYFERSIYFL